MAQVVVPRAGACRHRELAWQHLRPRYPWPVHEAWGGDPWIKAEAVNPVVEQLPDDVVIVADADVWTDGLPDAINAVREGAPWAIPHELVHRLNERGTAAVIGGQSWRGQPLDQPPYLGVPGGGIVVAQRDVLHAVPLDARFVGWGQEDEAWAMALTTLLGEPWRGTADLVHLWHPPQPRHDRRIGSPEGWRLRRRYVRAQHDFAAMRQLIDEIHGPLPPHQPAVHDRPPIRIG